MIVMAALVASAGPVLAGPTCSPSDDGARIPAAPSLDAIHRDWRAPNRIGQGWSLQVERSTHDAAGTAYYLGDLYSPRGAVTHRRVYVIENEWDCGP